MNGEVTTPTGGLVGAGSGFDPARPGLPGPSGTAVGPLPSPESGPAGTIAGTGVARPAAPTSGVAPSPVPTGYPRPAVPSAAYRLPAGTTFVEPSTPSTPGYPASSLDFGAAVTGGVPSMVPTLGAGTSGRGGVLLSPINPMFIVGPDKLRDVRNTVEIEIPPTKVTTFDPNNPPGGFKAKHDADTGVVVEVEVTIPETDAEPTKVGPTVRLTSKPSGMKVTVRVETDTRLPKGQNGKLTTHEQGHALIAQLIVRALAAQFADEAGLLLYVLPIDGFGPDRDKATAALEAASDARAAMIEGIVGRRLDELIKLAQHVYDLLTSDGTDDSDQLAVARQVAAIIIESERSRP